MTVPNSPVWFITGCSTGFGRELARLVLDLDAIEAAREVSLGADFPDAA